VNGSTAHRLDATLAAASAALSERRGRRVVLTGARVLAEQPRSVVVRCTVDAAPGGASSVVVKWFKPGHDRGFVEWASLALLAELPSGRELGPALLCGDAGHRLLIVEDLGDAGDLDDVLAGRDPAALGRALRALAVRYARLHAATASPGLEERFERLRDALPGADGAARAREADAWTDGRGKVEGWLAAAGVAPVGLGEAMAAVAAAYRAPGPWLAFTHGDPAPSNNHFGDDGVRLLDFEYGAFRHALYDMTAWDVLCPLPARLVDEMRDAHRDALAPALPAARAAGAYEREWQAMTAYRAIAMLTWIPPAVMDADAPRHGDWTERQAVFVAAARLRRATAEHPALARLAGAADAFAAALADRWPAVAADHLPRWPAVDAGRV
jgi:hypothetical protein